MGWLLMSPRLKLQTTALKGWLQKTPQGLIACTEAKALAQVVESVDQAWAGVTFLIGSWLAILKLPSPLILCAANLGRNDGRARD